ncbi:AtpZ/AtpI family protein [Fulvivirgaceae bacterium BMA12]|uniref:AtpZ/AtpI family protein n=1 Tax=Agaribacillus aureus TaxID=3051825 RepID=A0ABT8L5Z9_9BACT|nr:AtpZ/AtpI family protein [Fulvivirgaceae bacterium BMA12]
MPSSEKKHSDRRPDKRRANQLKNYARYSGLGFQLLVSLLLGFFIGQKLDHWVGTKNPWFTISLIFLAFFASMVYLIKKLPK